MGTRGALPRGDRATAPLQGRWAHSERWQISPGAALQVMSFHLTRPCLQGPLAGRLAHLLRGWQGSWMQSRSTRVFAAQRDALAQARAQQGRSSTCAVPRRESGHGHGPGVVLWRRRKLSAVLLVLGSMNQALPGLHTSLIIKGGH